MNPLHNFWMSLLAVGIAIKATNYQTPVGLPPLSTRVLAGIMWTNWTDEPLPQDTPRDSASGTSRQIASLRFGARN